MGICLNTCEFYKPGESGYFMRGKLTMKTTICSQDQIEKSEEGDDFLNKGIFP